MTWPHPPTQATVDVYLLFAHEPYYPGSAAQEVNTSVAPAASLLHPHVRQPDGTRVHALLTRGRRPGHIVPLATLTHELGGGSHWPAIGDWETVTTDLVRLIRSQSCAALSLGLPTLARALVCTGPHSQVRTHDPDTGRSQVFGPADRREVLAAIGSRLLQTEAGIPLWPGDGLLAPARSV